MGNTRQIIVQLTSPDPATPIPKLFKGFYRKRDPHTKGYMDLITENRQFQETIQVGQTYNYFLKYITVPATLNVSAPLDTNILINGNFQGGTLNVPKGTGGSIEVNFSGNETTKDITIDSITTNKPNAQIKQITVDGSPMNLPATIRFNPGEFKNMSVIIEAAQNAATLNFNSPVAGSTVEISAPGLTPVTVTGSGTEYVNIT